MKYWKLSLREKSSLRREDFILSKAALYHVIRMKNLQIGENGGKDLFLGGRFQKRKDEKFCYYMINEYGLASQKSAPDWWRPLTVDTPSKGSLCVNRYQPSAIVEPYCLEKTTWWYGNQSSYEDMINSICYCTICAKTTCGICMTKTVEFYSSHLESLGIVCSQPSKVHLNVCPNCIRARLDNLVKPPSIYEVIDMAEAL